MPSLRDLNIRRIELEKLSDYHRVLLSDALSQSAASLRFIEVVSIALTNPVLTKLALSTFLTQALPTSLKKLFPAFKGIWQFSGAGLRVISFLAQILSVFFAIMNYIRWFIVFLFKLLTRKTNKSAPR